MAFPLPSKARSNARRAISLVSADTKRFEIQQSLTSEAVTSEEEFGDTFLLQGIHDGLYHWFCHRGAMSIEPYVEIKPRNLSERIFVNSTSRLLGAAYATRQGVQRYRFATKKVGGDDLYGIKTGRN